MTNPLDHDTPGYLFTMDIEGLSKFVSDKEGALNIIEQLRGGVKSRWEYSLIRNVILALIQEPANRVYQTYKIPAASKLGAFTVHRARKLKKSEEWFKHIDDLGSPKVEKTEAYGRCHKPRAPMFYGSLFSNTVLPEINAELRDHVVISEYKFEQDFVVLPVGELDYYRRTGGTYFGSAIEGATKPYDDVFLDSNNVVPALIDAFLADEFIKPAATETDYKITSAFSDIILNEFPQNTKIDAIVYPSVAFRGGMNFAIRPESEKNKMKLVGAEIIEITDVVGYGIFGHKQLGKLKSVTNGNLDWENITT